MKTTSIVSLLSVALLCSATAQTTTPATQKKRPTHADIIAKREAAAKEAAKKATRAGNNENTPKVGPAILRKKKSLLGRSTLLANNNQWTLIPKGAVIHIPEHLKDKIILKPEKRRIVDWKTFHRINHGWIHIHKVNMDQARGNEKISQKTIQAYKTMRKVVVATNNGDPISVAPNSLKPEEEKVK